MEVCSGPHSTSIIFWQILEVLILLFQVHTCRFDIVASFNKFPFLKRDLKKVAVFFQICTHGQKFHAWFFPDYI